MANIGRIPDARTATTRAKAPLRRTTAASPIGPHRTRASMRAEGLTATAKREVTNAARRGTRRHGATDHRAVTEHHVVTHRREATRHRAVTVHRAATARQRSTTAPPASPTARSRRRTKAPPGLRTRAASRKPRSTNAARARTARSPHASTDDREGQSAPAIQTEPAIWSVYLVRCADDSLYCGVSTDVEARVGAHNEGKGARYTRSRRPVALVFSEPVGAKGDALRRELEIKSLPLERKRALTAAADTLALKAKAGSDAALHLPDPVTGKTPSDVFARIGRARHLARSLLPK